MFDNKFGISEKVAKSSGNDAPLLSTHHEFGEIERCAPLTAQLSAKYNCESSEVKV
jgi:hypothetical protein